MQKSGHAVRVLRRIALALTLASTGCSLSSEGIAGDPNFLEDVLDTSASGETSVTEDSTMGDTGESPDTAVESDTGAGGDTGAADSAGGGDTFVADTLAADTLVADTLVADTFVADTFVADTFVADTLVADTFVADTFVADTFVPDTFVPDTFVPDTFVPDTFVPDTSVADTAPETPAVGVLKVTYGEQPAASYSINLSTEGTIDWAHWGLGAAGNWNHKSGATALVKGTIGGATRFTMYPSRFSWTGGTPTASVTNTDEGIYHDANAEFFQFDAAGDSTAERTLKVYGAWRHALVGGAKTSATVNISLNDSSATAWSGTLPPPGASDGTDNKMYWVEIKYRPVASTGRVVVKITKTAAAGYISLLAATLK